MKGDTACLPASVVQSYYGKHPGFTRLSREALASALAFRRDLPRAGLEMDPAFKQLVSYCLIRRRGMLLAYERGTAGNESRLHAAISLGVGGHVEAGETVAQSVVRELVEEVGFGPGLPGAKFNLAGVVNENDTETGMTHLGVVYTLDLPDGTEVASQEADLEGLHFATLSRLDALSPRMERWSQICLESITRIFPTNPAL